MTIDHSMPATEIKPGEIDSLVLSRVEMRTAHINSKAGNGWKPTEVEQQRCLALLDHVSDIARELYLTALTRHTARCADCGAVARIQRVRTKWDLPLWCDTSGCRAYDTSLLDIELKPWGAPPNLSPARLDVWDDLIKRCYLIGGENFLKPGPECDYGTCGQCSHDSYRNNPALPQVIVNAVDNVPRLLLTDYDEDLNFIFGLSANNYTIAKVPVRKISVGLTQAASAITSHLGELPPDELAIISLATTALWMRTPWSDFEALLEDPNVRRLLPEHIVRAATQLIAERHAPKSRNRSKSSATQ